MCTLACISARIRRIVYGATRNDVDASYFDTLGRGVQRPSAESGL
jgi:tRNA(Arg) A34 adenosine deaminase TadA